MRSAAGITMALRGSTLTARSFLQPPRPARKRWAALVATHCGRAKNIADLFCGVGPFALRLAWKRCVAAFDSDAGAVAALQKAAAATPGLKPLKAEARDLFRRPRCRRNCATIDAVVFDPPRQGALGTEPSSSRERGAGRDCGVLQRATFARDARLLIDGGYKLEGVTPVDQFRHTPHVELVARFVKRRKMA